MSSRGDRTTQRTTNESIAARTAAALDAIPRITRLSLSEQVRIPVAYESARHATNTTHVQCGSYAGARQHTSSGLKRRRRRRTNTTNPKASETDRSLWLAQPIPTFIIKHSHCRGGGGRSMMFCHPRLVRPCCINLHALSTDRNACLYTACCACLQPACCPCPPAAPASCRCQRLAARRLIHTPDKICCLC